MTFLRYKVISVLNNNTIQVSGSDIEGIFILISKVIGFNRKKGTYIEALPKDQQIYKLWTDEETNFNLSYDSALLFQIISDFIVTLETMYKKDLSSFEEVLKDHLSFALDRKSAGIDIDSPLKHELSVIYPTEHSLAAECIRQINNSFGNILSESETGLLTIHIRAAVMDTDISREMEQAKLMDQIYEVVHKEYPNVPLSGFLLRINEYIQIIRSKSNIDLSVKAEKAQNPLAMRLETLIRETIHINSAQLSFLSDEVERLSTMNKIYEEVL